MSKHGFGKFLAGASVGAALALLFAPKKGEDTRKDIKKVFDDLMIKVKSMDKEEVKENVEKKINQIRKSLEELDKEKVLAEAKKQASKVRKQAEDLVNYAIENGTPVIEKSANAVQNKVNQVSKDVLNKLEKAAK